MSEIAPAAITLAMVAVAVALILGLFSFMREGAKHRSRSNRLMQWRVGLQLLVVVLLVIYVFVIGGGR